MACLHMHMCVCECACMRVCACICVYACVVLHMRACMCVYPSNINIQTPNSQSVYLWALPRLRSKQGSRPWGVRVNITHFLAAGVASSKDGPRLWAGCLIRNEGKREGKGSQDLLSTATSLDRFVQETWLAVAAGLCRQCGPLWLDCDVFPISSCMMEEHEFGIFRGLDPKLNFFMSSWVTLSIYLLLSCLSVPVCRLRKISLLLVLVKMETVLRSFQGLCLAHRLCSPCTALQIPFPW